MRPSTFVLFSSVWLVACGDDVTVTVDSGDGSDVSVTDASRDVAREEVTNADVEDDASHTDGSVDVQRDVSRDVTRDVFSDAEGDASDASDASDAFDAGSCGAAPACGPDETCWGEGCNCIREIDGDSYLRTDGTVVYYLNSGNPVAETAAGVPLTGIVEIMDGWRHTCGLHMDGSVWCWAKSTDGNMFGELGDGSRGGATVPMRAAQVLVEADTPLTGITHLNDRNSSRCYLESTTCGIRGADGAVFCWGLDNSGGGTGSFFTEGTVAPRPYATQLQASEGVPLTGIVEISMGTRHACAIDGDGAVLCWGMNVGGPLGQGDQTVRQFPTPVVLPDGITADEVGAGADFTCIRSGDEVYCWGASGQGQLGFAETPADFHDGCSNYCHTTPVQVVDETNTPLSNVVELETHYLGACARLSDHTLRCWGAEIGNRAVEPIVGGATLSDVAHHTSCSSTRLPAAIRYIQRDGSLHRPNGEVTPVCATVFE